jgi:hypothetical protein
MLNASSKRSRPARDVPAGVTARTDRVMGGQTAQRFGAREQQSFLEAAYALPEPEVAEYSGVVKVAILAMGCVAGWGVVLTVVMIVRFLGGF